MVKIVSTIDFAMEFLVIKSRTCNLNSLSPLKRVGLMLFNKQPLPYNLGWKDEILMGV
jgi:hypothetical protein